MPLPIRDSYRWGARSETMKTLLTPRNEMDVKIPLEGVTLRGDFGIPPEALGIVLFAHGSGSSRKSSRNRAVARHLQEQRIGTLLFDLLTHSEELEDAQTAHLRFNIHLLAERLRCVAEWFREEHGEVPMGFFGASTGGGAALVAAARLGGMISAVVSRGGRPDLAGLDLPRVDTPTLLIVGGDDTTVIELNRRALQELRCEKRMEIVPGASHLFEEPGALERVAELAAEWFVNHFQEDLPRAA